MLAYQPAILSLMNGTQGQRLKKMVLRHAANAVAASFCSVQVRSVKFSPSGNCFGILLKNRGGIWIYKSVIMTRCMLVQAARRAIAAGALESNLNSRSEPHMSNMAWLWHVTADTASGKG